MQEAAASVVAAIAAVVAAAAAVAAAISAFAQSLSYFCPVLLPDFCCCLLLLSVFTLRQNSFMATDATINARLHTGFVSCSRCPV